MDEEETNLDELDRGDSVAEDEQLEGEEAEAEGEEAEAEGEEAEAEGEEAEAEGEEAEAEGGKNYAIRLAKMREQRDRERTAREKLEAELQAARESAPKPKEEQPTIQSKLAELNEAADALYEQIEELRADAKTKEAAKLQRQLDTTNREIARIEAYAITSRQTAAAQQNAAYDTMLNQIEAMYPVLDPSSDDFDELYVADMEELVQAYEALGNSPVEALRKAAKRVLGEDPFARRKAAKQEAEPPKPAPKPRPADPAKAVATQKRQPPSMSDRGTNKGDDAKIRVDALSDEEFEKLPESKQRELRGDFA